MADKKDRRSDRKHEFSKVSPRDIIKKHKHSSEDLEYMSSLSSAVLSKSALSSRLILWVIILSVAWFIYWAGNAELDELVRGTGKVIPSSKVQKIQNLEGGIVDEFFVKEGDIVKKGQPLVKFKDVRFQSDLGETRLKLDELLAKEVRLKAEAYNEPFNAQGLQIEEKTLERERSFYQSNYKQFIRGLQSQRSQLNQKYGMLKETRAKMNQHKRSIALINKEIALKQPLVDKKIVSEIELLQLNREKNDLSGELSRLRESIGRINSEISEIREKLEGSKLEFRNRAKKELNEVTAEIERLKENMKSSADRVSRTVVKSPVEGIVKQFFINTEGGVVRPGMDIMEIVPRNEALLIEAKIKPSDIAFLHTGQKAVIKFTAYDFSIYGGLKGELTQISADTITDEEGNSFFLVKLKTDKTHLGSESNKLTIKVGMRTSVDIITGKKSILTYLLKPIIKAKYGALRER